MLTDGDAVFGSTDAEAAAVLQGDLCPGGDALAVDEGAVAGAFVYEDQELAIEGVYTPAGTVPPGTVPGVTPPAGYFSALLRLRRRK